MGETPFWFLILQAIANFAIVATFVVYWRQLVAMRGQLAAAQSASRNQNLLTLINFLQVPSLREDRGILIGLKRDGPPLEPWSPDQRRAAERVCAAYDITGILIRQEAAIPKQTIVDNWGDSIRQCHEAAADFIRTMQTERGNSYWDDFDWLAKEAGCLCQRCSNPPH
jgi:hypothetical protein